MTTLFQLHANMDSLKHTAWQMAKLWHSGDEILLMGESALLTDWLSAYISDINIECDNNHTLGMGIKEISNVFVLQQDINHMNVTANTNIDYQQFSLAKLSIIDDEQWVAITQRADRVVTLY